MAIRVRVSVRVEHIAIVKCATTWHIAQVEVSVVPVRVHAARRKPESTSPSDQTSLYQPCPIYFCI